MTITHTLRAVRNYRNKSGNWFDVEKAIYNDAYEYVGRNAAFLKIEARKNGSPLTAEENEIFNNSYLLAVRDASIFVFDKAYKAFPNSLKRLGLFREHVRNMGGYN